MLVIFQAYGVSSHHDGHSYICSMGLWFLLHTVCCNCCVGLPELLKSPVYKGLIPGHVTQSVMCLATDASLTADPGVAIRTLPNPILSWRLIMKLFLRSFSSLPLNHSRRVVVSYKRKYVHEVLVNCLFKLAQKKCV